MNDWTTKRKIATIDNLIILCWRCHPKVHSKWELKDWRIFL